MYNQVVRGPWKHEERRWVGVNVGDRGLENKHPTLRTVALIDPPASLHRAIPTVMYRGQLNDSCRSSIANRSCGLLIITTSLPSTPYTPVEPWRNALRDGRRCLSCVLAELDPDNRQRTHALDHLIRVRNEQLWMDGMVWQQDDEAIAPDGHFDSFQISVAFSCSLWIIDP